MLCPFVLDQWTSFKFLTEQLMLDEQSGEGRECLAYQLVTVLQQMAQRNCITEVSTQTSPAAGVSKLATRTSCTSSKDLGISSEREQSANRGLLMIHRVASIWSLWSWGHVQESWRRYSLWCLKVLKICLILLEEPANKITTAIRRSPMDSCSKHSYIQYSTRGHHTELEVWLYPFI